ncbi:MAG TPA: hypothetical protein VGJ38_09015 [Jatrophihabitantaceae bacterium]|jgi:hypothetical protein
MGHGLVTQTRMITADPQTLFDIVADPAMHPVIDGSGTVRAARPGTLVTEQWDPTRATSQLALRLSGFPARNRRAMRRTLERLEEVVTG